VLGEARETSEGTRVGLVATGSSAGMTPRIRMYGNETLKSGFDCVGCGVD
jgi:hypothetical protein